MQIKSLLFANHEIENLICLITVMQYYINKLVIKLNQTPGFWTINVCYSGKMLVCFMTSEPFISKVECL